MHGLVLLYTLVATAAGVVAWRTFLRHGNVEAVQRLERRMAGTSILALVLGAMLTQPL